ncbi:MAG: hypothetical protein CR974_04315 [Gammaproteobacteria bacterium]|nr:MAG: hypothetical protein CR974_04315 [Gammaproteobacteria bacterium]
MSNNNQTNNSKDDKVVDKPTDNSKNAVNTANNKGAEAVQKPVGKSVSKSINEAAKADKKAEELLNEQLSLASQASPADAKKQPTHSITQSNDMSAKKSSPQQSAKAEQVKKDNKNSKKIDDKAPQKPVAKSDKPAGSMAAKPAQPAPAQAAPEPAKKGGLVPVLALLTGIAGTGLGVYNFDLMRKSNDNSEVKALTAQVKTLEDKLAALNTGGNTQALEKKLSAQIAKATASAKADNGKFNQRLSAIEQTQNGLTKTLQGDVKATLDKRLAEINELLKKVDQMELTQKGISQNLRQAVAAGEAVTAEGMAKQEISYLLRMADYKVENEGDAESAAGLLEIAEKKLLLLNKGKSDKMVENIRQRYIQLRGVKAVDSNAIIADLRKLSATIPNLKAKPSEQVVETVKVVEDKDGGMLATIGNAIASGVKYTPNDPSKIDISAETVLIEKRLMQADIRTAELAVRSENGVLLAETLSSLRAALDKYFADDATAKSIKATLANIEKQKLETVLPDLSSLAEQFDNR